MAIIKPVLTPHGITCEYHKLLKAEIDVRTVSMKLTVAIYASQETRDNGGTPVWHEYPTVPFSDLTQDPRDLLYPMLAAYVNSYLVGGDPDSTMEGFQEPGNTSISLKPEVIVTPPVE